MRFIALTLCVILLAWSAQSTSTSVIRNTLGGGISLETGDVGRDTWKDIVDAFMEGSEVDELIANSTECLHDTENTYEDMAEAIQHFVKRGWSWENWLDLNGALGTLTPFIRTCYDVGVESRNDVNDHFGQFKSLSDFAMQARDNIVAHIFDWYDVIAKLNEAFTKGKNKEIAFQAGRAVTLFLNFEPKGQTNYFGNDAEFQDIPDFRWLEEFIKGFLNGTQVLSSQRIQNCVNETEFMVASVEDANAQFKKHTEESYREGVFELADMAEHLKPLNEECYYGIGDIEATIQKYIKTFKTPLDILFNAAKHFNEIYVDAISFMQHYNKGEWYDAGKNAGDIFYNIFFTN